MGGDSYKKIRNLELPPELQVWYGKKEILITARGGMEDILFSPELPRYLAEEWSRLKALYAFLDGITAE